METFFVDLVVLLVGLFSIVYGFGLLVRIVK